jgi:hypothetical protein
MPKIGRGRTKLHDRAPAYTPENPPEEAEPQETEDGTDGADGILVPQGLSRGQRKRWLQRERYLRKFDFVQFQLRQKELAESLDLNALAADLPSAEAAETAATAPKVTRAKISKTKEKEIGSFEKVLAFQPFKENPLAAIREHLTNTIAREKAKKTTKKGN